MAEEKTYAVVKEGNEIVSLLKKRYEDELWTVKPEEIVVLGVENKERPASSDKLATIRKIDPATRTLLDSLGSPVKYIAEVYWSDWNLWSQSQKQWILFHELLHIPAPDDKGTTKHDTEDFALILDKVGVRWMNKQDLPDMLSGEKVAFDLKFLPLGKSEEE